MEYFNIFGFAFIIAMLIPNIIFALKTKSASKINQNKRWVGIVEQIGRFGCLIFMIVNVPKTWFGWWSDEAFSVYLVIDIILVLAYCILWIVLWNKDGVFKALALSIIPSVIFIFSAVMSRSVLLMISALIFAPAHIYVSYKNA